MPPATDLDDQVLHHLTTSTKRVPAQRWYIRHVTVVEGPERNCSRTHSCWLHKILHQLFQRLVLHRLFQYCRHIPHRFYNLRVSSVSIAISAIHRGCSFLCSPRLQLFHHVVDLLFTHYHLWLRVPQVLVGPLKVLPCQLRLLVPSPEDVLPRLGNHHMDFL